MSPHYIARLALEWWRNSGRRTLQRLDEVVDHYAGVYATNPETVRPIAHAGVMQSEVQGDA